MGLSDHYVASLKGTILSQKENVQIVDISHSIKPFDVASAAFQLQCCYRDFPEGTIHLIGVDSEPLIQPPEYSDASSFVSSFPTVMKFNNQYFIAHIITLLPIYVLIIYIFLPIYKLENIDIKLPLFTCISACTLIKRRKNKIIYSRNTYLSSDVYSSSWTKTIRNI